MMENEKIFKVSEFNELIDILVSQQSFIVEGEITEISISQRRWVFITVKDGDSNLEVFSTVDQINTLDLLSEGMLVHVYGTPHLHRKSGRFRLHAYQILPAGEGELRIAFEKLKGKLDKEGLFAPERKRKLPKYPEKIGLLTAAHSAALSDFIKVLKSRMVGIKIFHLPISVGGVDAISNIASGIKYLNDKYPDLDMIVLTRGGGSLEDLQAFNSEKVARSIFSSKIPIVSAIGHEKDWTIADLVADLRASTPSNAAEIVVKTKEEIISQIENFLFRQNMNMEKLLEQKKEKVNDFLKRIEFCLISESSKFDKVILSFKNAFQNYILQMNESENKIQGFINNSYFSLVKILEKNKYWYNKLVSLLKILDYQNVLNRGFSITFNYNGKVIKDNSILKPKEIIKTRFAKGEIISEVRNKL